MNTSPGVNAVTVACARLSQPLPASTRAALRAQLPYARQLQLATAVQRQSQSLLAVALACELLTSLTRRPLRPAQLRYTLKGKPYAPGYPDFSISHSGDWVVCAVASRGAIGVDIEALNAERTPGALAAWSNREATLKAAGAHLRDLPRVQGGGKRLQFQGRRWYGHAPRLTPDTVLRVVSSVPIARLRLLRRPAAEVIARQETGR